MSILRYVNKALMIIIFYASYTVEKYHPYLRYNTVQLAIVMYRLQHLKWLFIFLPVTASVWPFKIVKTTGEALDTLLIDRVWSFEEQHKRDLSLFANLTIVTASLCFKK